MFLQPDFCWEHKDQQPPSSFSIITWGNHLPQWKGICIWNWEAHTVIAVSDNFIDRISAKDEPCCLCFASSDPVSLLVSMLFTVFFKSHLQNSHQTCLFILVISSHRKKLLLMYFLMLKLSIHADRAFEFYSYFYMVLAEVAPRIHKEQWEWITIRAGKHQKLFESGVLQSDCVVSSPRAAAWFCSPVDCSLQATVHLSQDFRVKLLL